MDSGPFPPPRSSSPRISESHSSHKSQIDHKKAEKSSSKNSAHAHFSPNLEDVNTSSSTHAPVEHINNHEISVEKDQQQLYIPTTSSNIKNEEEKNTGSRILVVHASSSSPSFAKKTSLKNTPSSAHTHHHVKGVDKVTFYDGKKRNNSIVGKISPSSNEIKKQTNVAGIEVTLYETKSCESIVSKESQKVEPPVTRQMLYKEALYTVAHMLGKISHRFPASQDDMAAYVHKTFSRDEHEQVDFIELVKLERYPLTIVNVGIRRAENLAARDSNGLSDPYCLISVETEESLEQHLKKTECSTSLFGKKPSKKSRSSLKNSERNDRPMAEERFTQLYTQLPKSIRTSIEHQTLNPIWEQRFQCLALRPSLDILHVEVWDHDDDSEIVAHPPLLPRNKKKTESGPDSETDAIVQEGFYKGQRDDFIGKAMMKISEIPVEGDESWHYLHGKTHRGAEAQGRLKIQVWLTHAFRHGLHSKEYASPRVILEKLWDYILESEANLERVSGNEDWDGEIPMAATCLLFQYGLQTGMSESTQAIIRFNAYAKKQLSPDGSELRLRELDASLKRFDVDGDGVLSHCEKKEMIRWLKSSLKDPLEVIRNHLLLNSVKKVVEALKTIRFVEDILIRIGSLDEELLLETEVKKAIETAVSRWYDAHFPTHLRDKNVNKFETMAQISDFLVEVVDKLKEGYKSWKSVFWLEAKIDYMPLSFLAFSLLTISDLRFLIPPLLHEYESNDVMRTMLLDLSEEEKDFCRLTFRLYDSTQTFVHIHQDLFPPLPHTSQRRRSSLEGEGEDALIFRDLYELYRIFRPILPLWLGFSFITAYEQISICINKDNVIVEDSVGINEGSHIKKSDSAVDTALVFKRLITFVKELQWSDKPEGCIVLIFILETICFMTIIYARKKRRKIEKEGYFDTVDRFDISERLCLALNNITYVTETVETFLESLEVDSFLRSLESCIGVESREMKDCRRRIIESIAYAKTYGEAEVTGIINGIGKRVRPEIKTAWDECLLNLKHKKNSPLAPLLDYLESNAQILHQALYPKDFLQILNMFLMLTCEEICETVFSFPLSISSTTEQIELFSHLSSLFPSIVDFFKGGGDGLTEKTIKNSKELSKALKTIEIFKLSTEQLIALHFLHLGNEQMKIKNGQLGSLKVQASYHDGKISCHIFAASNLLPLDEEINFWGLCKSEASSDPCVEIEIISEGNVKEAKKTKIIEKSLNPYFDEIVEIFIDSHLAENPYAVIRFTLKDVDLISKNDFMGEALVPISKLPGVSFNSEHIIQPMILSLRSNEILNSPPLRVLKTRFWEDEAIDFVEEQLDRCVKLKMNRKKIPNK